MGKFDSLSVAMEQRRQKVAQDQSNASSLHRVTINVPVEGLGEQVTDLTFPVSFVEEPVPWGGTVYAGTTGADPVAEYTVGNMPLAFMTVLAWTKDQLNVVLYVGATVGITTYGAEGDNFLVKAHFEGQAIRRAGKSS